MGNSGPLRLQEVPSKLLPDHSDHQIPIDGGGRHRTRRERLAVTTTCGPSSGSSLWGRSGMTSRCRRCILPSTCSYRCIKSQAKEKAPVSNRRLFFCGLEWHPKVYDPGGGGRIMGSGSTSSSPGGLMLSNDSKRAFKLYITSVSSGQPYRVAQGLNLIFGQVDHTVP